MFLSSFPLPAEGLRLHHLLNRVIRFSFVCSWLQAHHDVLILQYSIGSVLIFGIGYPICQALLLSLFSKALGPIPQV